MLRTFGVVLLFPATAFAYGEPDVDGLPNEYERRLHVFTNQLRQAPHDWPGWDTSLATSIARPPLAHQPGLNVAARFHADDMAANGCFTHESCDGTTFDARMARYFIGIAGENLYSALGDRSARSAITGWMNSDGHRANMLISDWTYLGTGFSENRAQVWYVQDFGVTSRPVIPLIPAGAWETRGQEVLLIANFWDRAGRRPREFSAIVGGATIPMERIAGPDGNETLMARIDAPSDCTELYYLAFTSDGDQGRYPSEGALRFGPECTTEFSGTAAPRPERPIIDADEAQGCTALHLSDGGLPALGLPAPGLRPSRDDLRPGGLRHGGLLPLLLFFGLALLRRR